MGILPLLLVALVAAPQQKPSDFITGTDTLAKERQDFYQAISSQLTAAPIKARTYVRADDTLGIAWRGNDDGSVGETYIFPAGHSDRIYVTGINPGWNAEQDVNYNSMTCFALVKGTYTAIWTLEWRDNQSMPRPTGGPGLTKIMQLDGGRVSSNKYVHDELVRPRPYVVYRKSDGESPWYSEFYDEQGNKTGSRTDDPAKFLHVFNTLVEEQDYLSHHN